MVEDLNPGIFDSAYPLHCTNKENSKKREAACSKAQTHQRLLELPPSNISSETMSLLSLGLIVINCLV